MPRALRLCEAARELGKSPATLRRWIAQGAPCEQPGEPGRGNGALVDPARLARWKAGVEATSEAEAMRQLAVNLRDYHRRNLGALPAHVHIGIPAEKAAAYLAVLYRYLANRVTGSDLWGDVPVEIQHLEETARK